ncbi:hypothetical protein HH_1411 [Helicobacter hepaticus ATCC 51449]|uniref:Uncharacterized protein n=1 Tax=Helicobacter hepaticus (strain ATCC 51449 / 3B1) TaxID=235279 RepID=Q7VGB1_HELHP|nr:hypothetical protein HH_1411 [Helicobacter hepaticus ATCC 51449]
MIMTKDSKKITHKDYNRIFLKIRSTNEHCKRINRIIFYMEYRVWCG